MRNSSRGNTELFFVSIFLVVCFSAAILRGFRYSNYPAQINEISLVEMVLDRFLSTPTPDYTVEDRFQTARKSVLESSLFTGGDKTRFIEKLSFGQVWHRAPLGECKMLGCPCHENFPCFQSCNASGNCAAVNRLPLDSESDLDSKTLNESQAETAQEPATAISIVKQNSENKGMIAFRSPRQTVILLELSAAFMTMPGKQNQESSNVGSVVRLKNKKTELTRISPPEPSRLLSEDFISALQVTTGLIEAFMQKAGPRDSLWVIGYAGGEIDDSKLLGPYKANSTELKVLWNRFLISPESSLSERNLKVQDLLASGFLPDPDSKVDAYRAITKASELITASPDYGISENRIALITSGLFSCHRSALENYSSLCKDGQLASCAVPTCEPFSSARAFDANMLAYREMLEVLGPKLVELGISVDSYLVGKKVLPHSLLFPNPDKSVKACMTPDEVEERNYPSVTWRQFRIPFKDPNEIDFDNAVRTTDSSVKSNSAYIAPNIILSAFSKYTHGNFHPVRLPCPPPPYFVSRDISNDGSNGGIDDFCAWSQSFQQFNDQPYYFSAGEESIGLNYVVRSQELVRAGVLDSEGRLLCEPGNVSVSAWAKNSLVKEFKLREKATFLLDPS